MDQVRPPDGQLVAALQAAGMPDVPECFSVALLHQQIPARILAGIDELIRVFDRVTTRPAWQDAATASAPEICRQARSEVCFFSAWDFHLPPDDPENWQLIECNDNGSGFLFAALINRLFYELARWNGPRSVVPPPPLAAVAERVAAMIAREAGQFFGATPNGLLLILDDERALRSGRFRHELLLLRSLCERRGWDAQLGAPGELEWDGRHLLWRAAPVSFVVNRSTDFFWAGDAFAPLRAAYADGGVYVAPNPFTYATRSDKRLLVWLSMASRDAELGITAGERAVLSAHVPETQVLRPENVDELAARKAELVFKPTHGFASRGLLASPQIGHARLRRLLKRGEEYVAQRRVSKLPLDSGESQHPTLWADLRVWAYRGERYLLSGRASRTPDALDLSPPGGWLPTYAEA
jgi:hypothetical protein